MNSAIDLTTLIFLVIAVVIFLRLWSVLGRRTGNERPPYDPYSAPPAAEGGKADNDNVVPLPQRQDSSGQADAPADPEEAKRRIRRYAPPGSDLEEGLLAIAKADPRFDPGKFLDGAKTAYEMIVMAFAEGNRKLLRQLLSEEVYDGFMEAIEAREAKNHKVDSSFVGIDKAEIVGAELRDKIAQVTVKFVSSLITATLDAEGRVIEGDPNRIREVTDIWTFARDVTQADPNWKLIATEAAA